MKHRHDCTQPAPVQRLTRLSDGSHVRLDRCPDCGAVALNREAHQ